MNSRETHRRPLLAAVWHDLRYAQRTLRRSPSLSIVAVFTLALGIGAATAMYTVLHGIALRELPVRDADQVSVSWMAAPERPSDHLPITYEELRALREGSRTFESVAGVAFQGAVDAVMRDGDRDVPVAMTWVTGEFFPLLDMRPEVGRVLTTQDDVPGAERVVVISHALWRSAFSQTPDIVGRDLTWNSARYTVVGVMPRGFAYPRHVQVWMPVLQAFPGTLDPKAPLSQQMVFDFVARTRTGVDAGTARTDAQTVLRSSNAVRPVTQGLQVQLASLRSRIVGDVSRILVAAAVAVSLLLLVACINVSNLLLIRGTARSQELAIRSALGAGRSRLAGQLFTEAIVLASLGGAIGIALAFAAVRVLVRIAPAEVPQVEMIALDAPVLLVALAITATAAIVAGLLPAVMSVRGDLGSWLRTGRGTAVRSPVGRALRHALLTGQVAMAVMVVVFAALLARSLRSLSHVDMGFNTRGLTITETVLPVPDRAQQVTMQETVIERLRALPGVVSATAMPKPPFSAQGGWLASYTGDGQDADAASKNPMVNFEVVGPGYFEALEVPLLHGRGFASQDRDDRERVAVVSASLAQRTWPAQDAIGKRIKLGPLKGGGAWHTIVGVAGDTRYRELATAQPTLYLPTRQFGGPVPTTFAVRTKDDAMYILPSLRATLRELNPESLIVSAGTMQQRLAEPLALARFSAFVLGASALTTLILALVGVYGTVATTVHERTREIGIRMALGESPAEVRSRVLKRGLALVGAGCAAGLVAAIAGTQLLRALLYDITPTDPATYAMVATVMLLVGSIACWLPARRATRVDPVASLRAD